MIAVVTPEEMGAIDAAAPEPTAVLVERAGAAIAMAAIAMLGGTYGRRVVVVAGKGNNGADGRATAERLRRRGVRVAVLDAAAPPPEVPGCDLLIDAAYGTGFRGTYHPPEPVPGTPVLAVDIPSGVSGLTGVASGQPLKADRTVTFAAYKPGLLLADGPALAGEVTVADIGLDVTSARVHLVEASDVAAWLPERRRDAHKWRSAVWLVAGSPGMTGAAHLAARAAQRAGSGYVRLSSPGMADDPFRPTESVGWALPEQDWAGPVLSNLDRFAALGVGPGLGRSDAVADSVRAVASGSTIPLVVDGDGLSVLDGRVSARLDGAPTVLTPHDGEFERMGGNTKDPDRVAATRDLARRSGATMLRKGSTTIVAEPSGRVLLSATGDARLATAGTGDVLTGIIAALLAQGLQPAQAAAGGAYLHGRAASLGWERGLVAGDIADLIPRAIADLTA